MGQPEQAGRRAFPNPVKEGADRFAGERGGGLRGGGQQHRDARPGGDPRRLDLGDHAAGADAGPAGAPDRDAGQVVVAARTSSIRRDAGQCRVAGVQTVHIGEQDQQVGVDERGHQRGEAVVVAEPDLLGGHGVVLVDDRDGAQIEQAAQGPVRVAVVGRGGSRRRR